MKPVKFVLVLSVCLMGFLILYFVFTVLNKGFWDARVRYLCSTEGGVTVYETVDLDAQEYANIPTSLSGFPFIPSVRNKTLEDPFYTTSESAFERKFGGITITRYVENTVRTADEKTLGTKISYIRSGGDFISVSGTSSSFSCSDITDPFELSIQIFNLNGVK